MKEEYFDELNKWRKIQKHRNKKHDRHKKNKKNNRNANETDTKEEGKEDIFLRRVIETDKDKKSILLRNKHDSINKYQISNISRSSYGRERRFSGRATHGLSNLNQIKRGMRYNIDDGHIHNHPLVYIFNDLQRTNRIQGGRLKKFLFKRKPFFGPRFKQQTRIGKLHHANVGTKLFEGIDD